jgi:diguanylate cyclase (GGDEF)-like protein/PAS domain S-box-containing protein
MGSARLPHQTISWNPQESDFTERRTILDALPVLVFLERAGNIVFANAEARQILGLGEAEWTPRPIEDVLWGLFPGTAEPRTLLAKSRRSNPFHATLHAGNGSILPVEGTYSVLGTELRAAVIVAHPLGPEAVPRPRLMEEVLASIPDALVILLGRNVVYTNPAFARMFGYTAEEACDGDLYERIVPGTRRHERTMLQKAVDQDGSARIETSRIHKNGDLVDVAILSGPLLVDGVNVGYVLTYRDIGERKRKEARLQHSALHDALTDLPNRALFLDRLSLALVRRSRRPEELCGVLFLDLDRFKKVNDSLGHAVGDRLLVAVAERLCATLRPQDSAARLGGDEFAILVENILAVGELELVARRVSREMERPFEIQGNIVQTGASVGVALAGPEHTAPELLIRDADFAMYKAKQNGGGRYEIFDKQLGVHFTSQQERGRELRHVLGERQFEVWYEPIYRLQNRELEGFESMLRVRRFDGSIESFRDLLPIAEDTGLAISLGRETLNTVCGHLRSWTDQVPETALTVSIKVTYRQFYHPDLIAQLETVLAATGVDPARLLIEVSETTMSESPDSAKAILQRIADRRVRIAMDDFGSGLAPLSHLMRLPLDVVKLDASLTVAATSTGRQLAALESLISLCHSQNTQVVAKEIENAAQLQSLRRIGCDSGQGRLLSRAVNPVEALRLAELAAEELRPVPDAGAPV